MFKGLLGEAVEELACLWGEGVVSMVSRQLDDGGSDFGAWPEATGGDLSHGLHVIVQLCPDSGETTGFRSGTGRKSVCNLRLHQHHHRLRRMFDSLNQLQQDARPGLVGEVGYEEWIVVARAVLDAVEGVARRHRECGRVPQRFCETGRKDRILLNGRDGRTAAQQLLGQYAETGTDLKHAGPSLHRRQFRGVDDCLESIAVNEKILPEYLVGMEAVGKAPLLDLGWTCEVHCSSGIG